MKIYTIGHVPPDLDTVASAVVYANFLKNLNRYPDAKIIPLRAGEPNKEMEFVFGKFHVQIPESNENIIIDSEDKFVLVDHNESSQRHPKIENEKVIEVIDH